MQSKKLTIVTEREIVPKHVLFDGYNTPMAKKGYRNRHRKYREKKVDKAMKRERLAKDDNCIEHAFN